MDVILTPIYEPEFLGFSYGFRAGRGAHDALDALAFGIERRKVNWIIDADIRAFFDGLSRDHLLRFLEHRIRDKRVLRLIAKWLNAGVMEDDQWKDDLQGTPQGAVVSPILANVYLHYVLDLWFQKKWRARQRRAALRSRIFSRAGKIPCRACLFGAVEGDRSPLARRAHRHPIAMFPCESQFWLGRR